ncbi:PPE family protein, partial [Mycobacterium paragordonae]
MSFLTLPPEINSLNMLLGAGSAPMASVASAWDGLAAELGSASSFFEGVTSGLINDAWQGPAAAAMGAAASPYAAWLSAAGAVAEQAASQARVVVSAYETARSTIVHPALIAGNRNSFVSLVLSNVFGQNAPAIAAAEAAYEEFWAQDIVAMLGYHGGASAAAAALTPFTKLPLALGGAGGVVKAVAAQASGLATAVAAAARGGSGNLSSLLGNIKFGGADLGSILRGVQAGTGGLANLKLQALGWGGTGSGALASAASSGRGFGSFGGSWGRQLSVGGWESLLTQVVGSPNVTGLVTTALSSPGLTKWVTGLLSNPNFTAALTNVLSSQVVSQAVHTVANSPVLTSAVNAVLENPGAGSLVTSVLNSTAVVNSGGLNGLVRTVLSSGGGVQLSSLLQSLSAGYTGGGPLAAVAAATTDAFGNTGTGNIGFGNTGDNNIGFGNTGNGNIGIGNSGVDLRGILNAGVG